MAVAWLGMAVNTGCLYVFKGLLHVRLIPASVMAIEIAIIHNFIWYRSWTWRDRPNKPPFFQQLIKYNIATGAVDFLGNVSVLWILATFLNIHYLLANILGMIAPPFIKFWLNEKVIFKASPDDSDRPNSQIPD